MMKAEARKRVFVKSRDLYNERDRSIAEVHRLLKQISDDPNHSFSDTVPPRSILYDWFKKWGTSGPIPDVTEFRDRPRSGAPRKKLEQEVLDFIERQILALKCPGPTQLARKVNGEFGRGTISRGVAEQCYVEIGEALITTAWFGSKESIASSRPKLTGTAPPTLTQ